MRIRALATLTGLIAAAGLFMAGGSKAIAQESTEQPNNPTNEAPASVVVERGDTLIKIADKHATTYVRLFFANPAIEHPDLIYPGDTVRIPAVDEQLTERPLPGPIPAKVPALAKPRGQSRAAPAAGSVWDRLAACESGGNWSYNGPSGYDGGLQFLPSTWNAMNTGYAYAWQAPREIQIAAAQKLLAQSGWGQWPACSSKLGLR